MAQVKWLIVNYAFAIAANGGVANPAMLYTLRLFIGSWTCSLKPSLYDNLKSFP